jgi:hypothetical protein
LAFAFELTEQFSPVPLLKSYLKEARKASSPVKSGNSSPTAQVCFVNLHYIKQTYFDKFPFDNLNWGVTN